MTAINEGAAATCLIKLTTTEMTSAVGITSFQFGTVPAPPSTYDQTTDSVAAGTTAQQVFWIDRSMLVPAGQTVCFNVRFELNVHNSANLQVRLSPGPSAESVVEWRWSAPIGAYGAWSAAQQQAPWYDDAMDYCITIEPDGSDISVALREHPASGTSRWSFIPPQHGMVRPR